MRRIVCSEQQWKRSWMPATASRAATVQLHMTKYHDTLMRDMRRPLVHRRWWEWLLPIAARDYKLLLDA